MIPSGRRQSNDLFHRSHIQNEYFASEVKPPECPQMDICAFCAIVLVLNRQVEWGLNPLMLTDHPAHPSPLVWLPYLRCNSGGRWPQLEDTFISLVSFNPTLCHLEMDSPGRNEHKMDMTGHRTNTTDDRGWPRNGHHWSYSMLHVH